jgi:hypothetical protein
MPIIQPDFSASPEELKKITMLDAIRMAARDSDGLKAMGLPPRNPILGDWFKEGDLGFIYAPRGIGKTWISLAIASAMANGRGLGPWQSHGVYPVCYVDGEMAWDSLHERMDGMEAGPNLFTLNHEALFHLSGKVVNIAEPETQQAITDYCLEEGFRVLTLDNLACVAFGMEENKADAWEAVLGWLLTLRRHKIAVIIVHHAGRNGEMRGTSKREDSAFWVLRLDAVTEEKSGSDKQTRFISTFTKERNSGKPQTPIEWTFQTGQKGLISVSYKKVGHMEIFRQWIADGLRSATDIAKEMGVTKGAVSKWAMKAEAEGWLKKENGEYRLVS